MRYHEIIQETMNQPYSWTTEEFLAPDMDIPNWIATFMTEFGKKYSVDILGYGGRKATISFQSSQDYDQWAITGSGDQFRILATVKQIILRYCSKYKPDFVQFDAKEASRSKLYSKMVRDIPGYSTEIYYNDKRKRTEFEFTRTIMENIRAFHGTPHEFDKFSLRFINTGEGNQAYGFGIYLAQNQDIANHYANTTFQHDLDDKTTIGAAKVDNRYFNARLPEEQLTALQRAALAYIFAGSNQNEAIRDIRDMLDFITNEKLRDMYRRTLYVLENEILAGRVQVVFPKIYHVMITRPDTDFILWRSPFSKQSPRVQHIMQDMIGGDANTMSGSMFYHAIVEKEKNLRNINSKEAGRFASMALYRHGIAGTRYLDATGMRGGEPLYNYVVFNPREIRIDKVEPADS